MGQRNASLIKKLATLAPTPSPSNESPATFEGLGVGNNHSHPKTTPPLKNHPIPNTNPKFTLSYSPATTLSRASL